MSYVQAIDLFWLTGVSIALLLPVTLVAVCKFVDFVLG